ncbi:MAG: hypothetical protein U0934_05235 [Pseudotabrizicola sp.]|uniref:sulfotransferase family protein n=1 Tax=Pseudotabrizicola sp. TaxID=2939647 RepID=UPI002719E3B5|nr:hypothetical protein [Pseudotabrizicola sp.]MDO8883196.1 hypothetical protein [Pseudotabrizicola sp.]MDP2080614.1 hypothetical protein [Pseudotabrizicola sp.]MDZ7573342.1 hypothetical protein [Pseudotabrizicola sp.]
MAKTAKKKPKEAPRKVGVIVLGMHRSGTSALGGVLTMLGCDAPATLMPPHPTNPKGFFESKALWGLNDDILEAAGSSWKDWLPFNSGWLASSKADAFAEQVKTSVLSEFPDSRLFVLKDPRMCRLLPLYLDVFKQIDVRPVIAHVHRNPLDVAASLHARDGLDPELGLLIWLRHVLDAERNSRGLRRSFLSYDQLIQNWGGVVDRLGKELKVSWPRLSSLAAAEIDSFLTPDLRHHEAAKEQVLENPQASAWIRDTYAILQRWADHGETEADRSELDTIAAEFSRGATTFSRLIDHGLDATQQAGKVQALLHEVAQLRSALLQRQHEAQEWADRTQKAETDLKAKALVEARFASEITELAARLARQGQDLDIHQQQRALWADERAMLRNTTAELERGLTSQGALLQQTADSAEILRQDVEEQQRQMADQALHIAQLSHVRDALLNSTSWKLTAPLRRIMHLFRKSD